MIDDAAVRRSRDSSSIIGAMSIVTTPRIVIVMMISINVKPRSREIDRNGR